ncbi:hypothetical protein HNR39_003146 [Glaciimonas immobilis]|uniref:Uncharacterized protein n=1 Tax=Glaciimonas immobilis TaxID=728004 RepID=A0A840RS31_9BURK|nr:hypothetical protein [Glaciimonas immobilis]
MHEHGLKNGRVAQSLRPSPDLPKGKLSLLSSKQSAQ